MYFGCYGNLKEVSLELAFKKTLNYMTMLMHFGCYGNLNLP